MKKDFTIGVLGGMGTYATIHLFQQYAEIFEAEKEWDRPRMIIDNRCTMPSRVRAFLYNENVDKLVDEMADSMQRLKDAGCTRIVLACNTSHLFLPMIYEKVPGLEPLVIHIIRGCVDALSKDGVKEVYLLGTEGTIDSGVYQKALEAEGIKCSVPAQERYAALCMSGEGAHRDSAEAVRQLPFLKPDGCVVVSSRPVVPVSAMTGGPAYEYEAIMAYLREQVANLVVVDADHAAAELGSAKCLNVVLLGAASRAGELGLTEEDLLTAIHTLLPNKLWELNEQALKYTASLS